MQRTARPARYGAGMAHALKLHVMNVALGQTVGGAIIRAMQAAALEQRGQAVHMHDAENWRWNWDGHYFWFLA